MGRKRRLLSKNHGFQKGNVPANKGEVSPRKPVPKSVPVNRLTQDVFDSRVKIDEKGEMSTSNAAGIPSDMKILRPKPAQTVINTCMETTVPDPDNYTYKLLRPIDVERLWNNAILEHQDCTGYLKFDSQNSKQWGWGWSERLCCNTCQYVSGHYKLYEEEETKSRGRKRSTLNTAMQTALMGASVSNAAMIEICLTANIIPPSHTGLQNTANHVGEKIVEMNTESMNNIRRNLVEENRSLGLQDPECVNTEADGRYNNPLFSGERTPYQGATQVTYPICEQLSTKKKILSVFTGNKLCRKAEILRRQGRNIKCPDHEGLCTANVPEEAAIGNEETWATVVGEDISDSLKVLHHASDGDSKSFTGLRKSHPGCASLKDTRHLAKGIKKKMLSQKFSPNMFRRHKGYTYGTLKSRLANDVKARCRAELIQAHKVHNGDIDKIKKHMPDTIEAMLMCYKGYCGDMCQRYSYCCKGERQDHWKRTFLPEGTVLSMTEEDEKYFKVCVDTFLSTECLEQTKLLTDTQKTEAFNRKLQKTNPKSVTWYRNFPSRVHTAVHMSNHGFADSTILRLRSVGSHITSGSSVVRRLVSVNRRQICHRLRQKKLAYKKRRGQLRIRRYLCHSRNRAPVPTYRSGMDNPPSVSDHTYSK